MAHARGPERPAFAPRSALGKGRFGRICIDAVIKAALGSGIAYVGLLTGGPGYWVNPAAGAFWTGCCLLAIPMLVAIRACPRFGGFQDTP